MYKMKNSPCDGMVDITDLKSVALKRGSSSLPEGTNYEISVTVARVAPTH